MKNNIFIAFKSKKTTVSIAKMLVSEGMGITSIIRRVSDLSSALSYYKGGIIITSCVFDGVHIDELLTDIPDGYTVIAVGSKEQIDNCEADHLFKLAVPLHKNDLICAIEMMSTLESAYHPVNRGKSNADERLIDRAKHYLIDTYSMTEEQAHRYIQKKSMDTGRKLEDIARIILEI